jgi:hypothetical protein
MADISAMGRPSAALRPVDQAHPVRTQEFDAGSLAR